MERVKYCVSSVNVILRQMRWDYESECKSLATVPYLKVIFWVLPGGTELVKPYRYSNRASPEKKLRALELYRVLSIVIICSTLERVGWF